MHKNLTIPRVNPLVYGGFSFLVSIVAILTAVNFFVSPYQSIWDSMDGERWIPMLLFLALLAVGNLARITVMSRMVKE
jgi:hypothetical protein